jgi:hypothetical protein
MTWRRTESRAAWVHLMWLEWIARPNGSARVQRDVELTMKDVRLARVTAGPDSLSWSWTLTDGLGNVLADGKTKNESGAKSAVLRRVKPHLEQCRELYGVTKLERESVERFAVERRRICDPNGEGVFRIHNYSPFCIVCGGNTHDHPGLRSISEGAYP